MGALLRNWTCNSVPQVWHKPLDATWEVRKNMTKCSNDFPLHTLSTSSITWILGPQIWISKFPSYTCCRVSLVSNMTSARGGSQLGESFSFFTNNTRVSWGLLGMISNLWVHLPLCTLVLAQMLSILPPVLLQTAAKNIAKLLRKFPVFPSQSFDTEAKTWGGNIAAPV